MNSSLLNWLKNILAKFSDVKYSEASPEILSPMERCRFLFKTINFDAFRNYTQTHGRNYKIAVVHANIEVCIEDLSRHTKTLDKSGYVLESSCVYSSSIKSLRQFFVSKDGFYLESTYGTVLSLQEAVLELCNAVDEAKHIEYDTKSYNLRMLNSLFHVLIDLGLSLEEVSKQNR